MFLGYDDEGLWHWYSPRPLPMKRNWEPYAEALDLYLSGWTYAAIGRRFGKSRAWGRMMVRIAGKRLAFRVFHGTKWEPGLR